jgi:hypothetical protein
MSIHKISPAAKSMRGDLPKADGTGISATSCREGWSAERHQQEATRNDELLQWQSYTLW